MLAKFQAAGQKVAAQSAFVSDVKSLRNDRNSLSLVRKGKVTERPAKGLPKFMKACANGLMAVVKSELKSSEEYAVDEAFGEM